MRFNITEIEDCIKDRRTIRPDKYTSRKVHKEVIERLLKAARWAPTHGATQPWHFKVFMEDGVSKIVDAIANTYKDTTPEDDFMQFKYDKIKKRSEQASVIIAICMKRQESEKIPEIEEIEAVACAVQNMHLLATAYGLGGFWSTGKVAYTKEIKNFLQLGEKDKCLGFFHLGYPEGEWPKSHRKPLEYNVEWIND